MRREHLMALQEDRGRYNLEGDYSVSRIIHGGWQFSSGHRLTAAGVDDALEVLVRSADLGVTTFDCADIYTGVEELYGRFIRRWKSTSHPTPLQIHTKFVPDYSTLDRVDRAYVERIIDRSLSRLGVEQLDLVQYYWWRDDVPGMEEAARWLGELQVAGKIRHIAATNMSADRLQKIEDAGVRAVVDQVQYSALDRRPEAGLVEHAESTGMRMLSYGALAGGFLTDRWLERPEPSDLTNRSLVKYRLIIDEFGGWAAYQRLLTELGQIAQECGVDLATVALRFVLDQPHVAAVIVGATQIGQMERNVRTLAFSLSGPDHARIRRHVDVAPGPLGDVFALERDRDGPHGRIMHYDLNSEV
jgi:aryl-alcohol dehydrogenase-like predicted oxidoreductase